MRVHLLKEEDLDGNRLALRTPGGGLVHATLGSLTKQLMVNFFPAFWLRHTLFIECFNLTKQRPNLVSSHPHNVSHHFSSTLQMQSPSSD